MIPIDGLSLLFDMARVFSARPLIGMIDGDESYLAFDGGFAFSTDDWIRLE